MRTTIQIAALIYQLIYMHGISIRHALESRGIVRTKLIWFDYDPPRDRRVELTDPT